MDFLDFSGTDWPRLTWTDLLIFSLLLWGGYWLLTLVRKRLAEGVLFGRYQIPLTQAVTTFLLLYEPITILLLTLVFVFINPPLHGLLLLLLTIAGFGRIRDYLSGRILLATSLIVPGKQMATGDAAGMIARLGRIGVYLQTGDRLRFVNYSHLLVNGYSLSTGEEVGGYYQLLISPAGAENPQQSLRHLTDRFMSTPYLERSFVPEVRLIGPDQTRVSARVSVREERHLRELLELLEEWGYPATVARS